MLSTLVNTNTGYRPGLVLVATNAQFCIGRAPGIELSGLAIRKFAEPHFNGRLMVPGPHGIAYRLAGHLFSHTENDRASGMDTSWAGFELWDAFGYDPEDKSHIVMDSNPSIYSSFDIYTKLSAVLKEVEQLAEYLEMPKMIDYKENIINAALEYYPRAIHTRFYSGKLRGKKKYQETVSAIMNQIDKLKSLIPSEKVTEFREKIQETIIKARQKGIDDRCKKREQAKIRKRKRTECEQAKSHKRKRKE